VYPRKQFGSSKKRTDYFTRRKLRFCHNSITIFKALRTTSIVLANIFQQIHLKKNFILLLFRHVVDACSFFKTNSFLLGGSTNNVERQCCPPRSFTTTEIHRPATACYNCLQEISITPEITKSAVITRDDSSHRTTQNLRLHAKELTLIGLPIYDRKRNLIERVVEGVAEVIRGGSSIVLLSALDKLLKDGLKPGIHPWDVIKKITGKGFIVCKLLFIYK
jgi:hypothetical protein